MGWARCFLVIPPGLLGSQFGNVTIDSAETKAYANDPIRIKDILETAKERSFLRHHDTKAVCSVGMILDNVGFM